jgi:hypothetical protein
MLANGPVSWGSKKQPVIALSSTEAEYIAMSTAVTELSWLRRILGFLLHKAADGTDRGLQLSPSTIHVDNISCMFIARNAVISGHCKHIEVRWHNTRRALIDGWLKLVQVSTVDNIADIFTKALDGETFQRLRHSLCNCDVVQY